MSANPQVVAHAREVARKYGIDEATLLRAFGHEALNVFDPSQPDRGGDHGSSFGPAQLHYGGMSKVEPRAGLGDEFTKQTGLDARDPSTWREQLDFAAKWASQHGWGDWMGAAAEGITGMMGIGGRAGRGGGQYDLKSTRRHVGGAGSKPGYFTTDESSGGDVAASPPSADGTPPPLPDATKPKTWNEKVADSLKGFGDAFANIPGYKPLNMPGAEWMGGGGAAMPSVYRSQLMPTSVGGGMGGGGDMRQLLAMLMQGGGGRV
jgi:hypothetical protein